VNAKLADEVKRLRETVSRLRRDVLLHSDCQLDVSGLPTTSLHQINIWHFVSGPIFRWYYSISLIRYCIIIAWIGLLYVSVKIRWISMHAQLLYFMYIRFHNKYTLWTTKNIQLYCQLFDYKSIIVVFLDRFSPREAAMLARSWGS